MFTMPDAVPSPPRPGRDACLHDYYSCHYGRPASAFRGVSDGGIGLPTSDTPQHLVDLYATIDKAINAALARSSEPNFKLWDGHSGQKLEWLVGVNLLFGDEKKVPQSWPHDRIKMVGQSRQLGLLTAEICADETPEHIDADELHTIRETLLLGEKVARTLANYVLSSERTFAAKKSSRSSFMYTLRELIGPAPALKHKTFQAEW